MDVSVRELRNHTARVIEAVEAGERVVLTVHGRATADIVPHELRSVRRPVAALLRDLAAAPTDAAFGHDIADALNATTDDVAAPAAAGRTARG